MSLGETPKMETDSFSTPGVPKARFPSRFLGFFWGAMWVPLQTTRELGGYPATLPIAVCLSIVSESKPHRQCGQCRINVSECNTNVKKMHGLHRVSR